jgi:hypothetical protein
MISKDSKQRLFEVMERVAGLKPNLSENYPLGAELDLSAPWNQREEEPDVEEFDTYDRYRDDSMDETPNDGIDRNNPQYQIGSLTTQYNNLLKDIKKLYEYMNNNNPSVKVVKAIIETIISRQDKMQGSENSGINEVDNPETQDKIITTTYQIVTPESAEQGDYAEQGWKDEEGESMTPDEYDMEDGVTAIDKAVEFLKHNGANEPSSSPTITIGNTWYSTSSPDIDYTTGAETYYSYHLKGFTPEEEQEIYKRITKR